MRPCPELFRALDDYRRFNMRMAYSLHPDVVSENKPEDDKPGGWSEISQGWVQAGVWRSEIIFSAAFVRAVLERDPVLKSTQLFFEMNGGVE